MRALLPYVAVPVCTMALLLRSAESRPRPGTRHASLPSMLAAHHALPMSDPGDRGRWVLDPALSDDFEERVLNAAKWRPYIKGWQGRPPAPFSPSNVRLDSGMLYIDMRHETLHAEDSSNGFAGYSTGAVESTAPYSFGYIEVRAKAMHCAAASAIWLAAESKQDHNEVDVAEMGGNAPADPHKVYMSLHVFKLDGRPINLNDRAVTNTAFNVSQGFHVYGVDWEPDSIDFYIDGTRERHVVNKNWQQPAALILDAEIEKDWLGMPQDADLPAHYAVDYVHVWKHSR